VYRQTPILLTFYILLGALASVAHARRQAITEERATEAESAGPDPVPHECLAAEGV